MKHEEPSNENQRNTDQSTNYFGAQKSKQQITFEFIKWILGIVLAIGIAYGTLETKTHSEATYVKKEVQEALDKERDKRDSRLEAFMTRIEKKIDDHMSKK
jgi:hypothetical protein